MVRLSQWDGPGSANHGLNSVEAITDTWPDRPRSHSGMGGAELSVSSLGYLRLESNDIGRWKVFGTDFLGLMPVEGGDSDSLYYRLDDYPPRIVVAPGAESRMTAMGLEVLDERVLTRLVADVEKAGIKVTEGTAAEAAERRVTGFVRFNDPGENPVELYYGTVLDHVPVHTPSVSKFVTGDMGFGHAIVSAEDARATFDFYVNVMGFIERNTMKTPDGGTTWFMGCNPRHHTLGVTGMPGPGRLLHFMVEAATLDDVGRALDRAAKYEIPMMNSLGRHTNDHMVSFYVWSPEYYAVEFGWNGLQVPTPVPVYEITDGAFWGHHFTPPPPPPAA
jgi:3,4-dihydroxy-9,10-secoandrosta-1,3,5(10)-triene-9,17-dione 4,5-dioxygenase